MNPRASLTICFASESTGQFELSLDEETMVFSLTSTNAKLVIPDELTQWDACEPNQSRFAKRVVRCIYADGSVPDEVRDADTDRVHRLFNALLNTALPES